LDTHAEVKDIDFSDIPYKNENLNDSDSVNETGTSTLDLVNETLRSLFEVSNLLEDNPNVESNPVDSKHDSSEISSMIMEEVLEDVFNDAEEHALLVDIVKDFLENDVLDAIIRDDKSKIEPEPLLSLSSSFTETFGRSPMDEYQEFKFSVTDTVKKCLKIYYNNVTSFGQFRIVSEEHFTELCRSFSHRFREELKDSHVAFTGSISGLKLTPDHEMYIKQQIDIKLDTLQET